MRRSFFDLSHEHKLSCDMGQLIPVMCEEVLPGDTFIGQTSLLARVAPLVNPILHRVELRVHHWYVPNRILWSEWEDFITGEDAAATMPTVSSSSAATRELLDHMGAYPDDSLTYQALPVRAYNSIYNNYYRDQDLQTARSEDDLTLANICWEKDYFTTCRPSPQQGTAQTIGLTFSDAPVYGIGNVDTTPLGSLSNIAETGTAFDQTYTNRMNADDAAGIKIETDSGGVPLIFADMSNVNSGISIDDLRQAIALQRFAEARARYGERYVDYLRFLGVNPRDGRLSRPEFLGGGKQVLNFSEVLATAEGTNTEVGDLFGHGIAGLKTRKFRKMFEEHGWVLSLISARPKTVYTEHVHRKFTRTDNMDYWQRELENQPWQEVKQQEVYYGGSASTTFGYSPKYEEYRHGTSYVSGSFRSGPEVDWHMGRVLGSAPTLNSSFVTCTPTDRIYGDTAMPELLINAHNKLKAKRLVRKSASIQSL